MSFSGKLALLFAGFRNAANKLVESIHPDKRRFVLMISSGVIAVLLLIFLLVKLMPGDKDSRQNIRAAGSTSVRPDIIPPDELFIPDEPDFVPGVILDREQRSQWTAADAEPFWQDPLKSGEEQWRNRIEKAVDEIMERIP